MVIYQIWNGKKIIDENGLIKILELNIQFIILTLIELMNLRILNMMKIDMIWIDMIWIDGIETDGTEIELIK